MIYTPTILSCLVTHILTFVNTMPYAEVVDLGTVPGSVIWGGGIFPGGGHREIVLRKNRRTIRGRPCQSDYGGWSVDDELSALAVNLSLSLSLWQRILSEGGGGGREVREESWSWKPPSWTYVCKSQVLIKNSHRLPRIPQHILIYRPSWRSTAWIWSCQWIPGSPGIRQLRRWKTASIHWSPFVNYLITFPKITINTALYMKMS
jgi:hypothetical protein